jgi:3-oxoacyl-(acyl-carrier-protein) synthase
VEPEKPGVWDRALDASLFELLSRAGLQREALTHPAVGSFMAATVGRLPRCPRLQTAVAGNWAADLLNVAEQTAIEPLIRRWALTGPHWTFNAACASTNVAVGLAAQLIQAGVIDRALVSAMEVLNAFDAAGFHSSRLWDARACCPFDRNTGGIMLGEGGGILLLEAAPSQPPLGEIVGWASNNEAYDLAKPEPSGAALAECIQSCLVRSGLSPNDVDYVNAHGTGSRDNDVSETRALNRIWPSLCGRSPLVSGTKRLHGHLRAACGLVELVVCLLVLQENAVPPTFGCREPLEECKFELVRGAVRRRAVRTAVSVNRGFGGINSAVAVRAVEERPFAS